MDKRVYLKRVIDNIFNNWSALQLAVEHSMGGPLSRQTAVEFMEHLVDYCCTTNVDREDIEYYLEDVMDQEFNTVCEDNSIKEIAFIIDKFLTILKGDNLVQFEVEYNSLPNEKHWLSTPAPTQQQATNELQEEDCRTDEMVVDAEWTQVKSRRRK